MFKEGKLDKYYKYFVVIVVVFLLTLSAFLDYQSKNKDDIIADNRERITELEEKVEYYETELKRLYSEQDLDYESQSIY